MIVDDSTFTKIKPRISIRDQHYLKNQNKSLNVRQNIVDGAEIKQIEPHNSTMHNHIDGCLQLHSKKLLFKNFYSYLKKQIIYDKEKDGIRSNLCQLLIICKIRMKLAFLESSTTTIRFSRKRKLLDLIISGLSNLEKIPIEGLESPSILTGLS